MKATSRFRCFPRLLLVVLPGIFSGHVLAAAGDWAPELLAPAIHAYRQPTDPLRIRLPDPVPAELIERLSLELDAIDVTAMTALEGRSIVFRPAQPLAYGRHILRLLQYTEDGSILERGAWELDIRQSEHFREASVTADLNSSASQRIGEMNMVAPPGRLQAQGDASLAWVIADDDWRLNLHSSLLYNSRPEQTLNGDRLDLGEYLLTAVTENLALKIGHHAVPQTSLIADNFYRRGVSVDVALERLRSTLTGFAMRADQIAGFRDALGVGDSDNRVEGIVVRARPLRNEPERLDLQFSWLDGEGSAAGLNVADEAGAHPGTAWSVVADSALLSQQLRLRGEYAATDFDFDGKGVGFDEESDDAWSLLFMYTPAPTDRALNWNIGAEYLSIGTFFKSLANTSLPGDQEMARLFGGLYANTWSIEGSFARQEDNLEASVLLPTTRTRQGYASLTYSPYAPASGGGLFSWLGTQSHTLTLGYLDQKEIHTPAKSAVPPTDNRTESIQWQASFMHATWSWGGGLGWDRFRDQSGLSPDSSTVTASLNASLPLGERVHLSPTVQFQRTRDDDTGAKQSTFDWSLVGSISFIPGKLEGNFAFTLNRNKLSNDPLFRQDDQAIFVSSDLIWHWIAARTNRPGVDVSLSGLWHRVDDDVTPALSITGNQVFLSLIMTLPAASGGL